MGLAVLVLALLTSADADNICEDGAGQLILESHENEPGSFERII